MALVFSIMTDYVTYKRYAWDGRNIYDGTNVCCTYRPPANQGFCSVP